MVAGTTCLFVVLILVMGVADPVAAGEEMVAVASAGVTALEAGDALSASEAAGIGVGGEASAGVAPASLLREPEAAISEQTAIASAGYSHTCSVTKGGGVKCWGANPAGELGNGTTNSSTTPVNVVGLSSGAASVSSGRYYTCALTTSGGVKCWGSNSYGQLGDGTTTERWTPVDVVGLSSGVTAVSAGDYPGSHTCALTSGGGVTCWGNNSSGQLGNGTTTNSSIPVDVTGLSSGVVAVSAGGSHTCALTVSGGVKCWGNGNNTPVDVSGLSSGVVAIDSGSGHNCALATGGGVKCWGSNTFGQLGDGTTNYSSIPVDVVGLASGVTVVTAGGSHSCAVTTDGGVKCWGYNAYGQLGDSTGSNSTTPVDAVELSGGVATVSAGQDHTCGLTVGGGVKCWGYNGYGQLGNGTTNKSVTPIDVAGLSSTMVSVSAGLAHTCALSTSGGVKCWGYNYSGQLGDGTSGNRRPTPVDVVGLSANVLAVSVGGQHSCALTTGGGVKCWGHNYNGQLGDGTTTDRSIPVDTMGLSSGVVAISAGRSHTCALTTGGGVKCWGDNSRGQLGDGTTTEQWTPVSVVGLSSIVVAISAGYQHSCAVMTGGGVKCWGLNDRGQLGDGTTTDSTTPVDVVGLTSGATAVSADGDYPHSHTCATTTGEGIKCWGDNFSGQLGNGTTSGSSTPVDVIGLSSGATTVTAGGVHTCSVISSGGAKCWGYNSSGQLGNGTRTSSSTPVDVVGLPSGTATISAGSFHTCAVTTGGGVKCWGSNESGQLGVNPGWTPVDVLGLEGSVYTTIAKSGSNVVLTWLHMVSAVDHYEVYRSTTAPYFEPGGPGSEKLPAEPPAPPDTATEVMFTDVDVLGSPGSYFYAVVPVKYSDEFYATSNRTGAFNYGMTPGSGLRRQ